jgi:transposase
MARAGRPTVEIILSAEERTTLERWARRHSSSQMLALRSKIVLACAAGGATQIEIAAELGCNPVMVSKWRDRFAESRLDGLVDAPRPGAARTIGDDVIEAIVVETLESAPPDATHWSTRSLAPGTESATPRYERSGVRSASSRGEKTASRCRPIPT